MSEVNELLEAMYMIEEFKKKPYDNGWVKVHESVRSDFDIDYVINLNAPKDYLIGGISALYDIAKLCPKARIDLRFEGWEEDK